MSPTEVTDGIREYTGLAEHSYYLEDIMSANYVLEDVIGFILGVVVYLILILGALMTALDISYITIPIFQEKVREERWDGSSGVSKFRIISDAARRSVEIAQETGKSALQIYLKKRTWMYIMCGLCIFTTLCGSNVLISVIARFVKEIISAAYKIAGK